jgi:hypothetical protein
VSCILLNVQKSSIDLLSLAQAQNVLVSSYQNKQGMFIFQESDSGVHSAIVTQKNIWGNYFPLKFNFLSIKPVF